MLHPATTIKSIEQPKLFKVNPEGINFSKVFTEKKNSYINEYHLFVALFNLIPNYIQEERINCKNAINSFKETYNSEIVEFHYSKKYYRKNKNSEYDDVLFILRDEIIISFDVSQSLVAILFHNNNDPKVDGIIAAIKKFKKKKPKTKPTILLLVNEGLGISAVRMRITKPKLSIADNYNDDFKDIHSTILKRLSQKNDKGLVLLHGKPGTGKTSYIRYLITSLKKNVIFLPPNMAAAITDPGLIPILIEHTNSVFVIEDAENIIVDRDKNGQSPVSALLNISDGLLSDCLNIQIICSFNTDISKVDNALLRKGRLIAKYEFKDLETDKATLLSQNLGYTNECTGPMSLSAIYNQLDKDFEKKPVRKQIGFK